MSIHDLIEEARRRLLSAGLQPGSAAFDAEYLAREALGWDRARLLTEQWAPAPPGFTERYETWVRRRAAREPAHYITGHREFWKLDFEVTSAVLLPRPETEFIVEEALAFVVTGNGGRAAPPDGRLPFWLADVGTGSGCLAVSLAHELPSARVVATDISLGALAVATRNARRHGVADRIAFIQGDLLSGVADSRAAGTAGPFELIVANPPYVPGRHLPGLQPEVRDHEPREALAGGDDGLAVLRRLLPEAASRLRAGGRLIFEFGDGQAEDVERLVANDDRLALLRIRDDLHGIARTAVVERR